MPGGLGAQGAGDRPLSGALLARTRCFPEQKPRWTCPHLTRQLMLAAAEEAGGAWERNGGGRGDTAPRVPDTGEHPTVHQAQERYSDGEQLAYPDRGVRGARLRAQGEQRVFARSRRRPRASYTARATGARRCTARLLARRHGRIYADFNRKGCKGDCSRRGPGAHPPARQGPLNPSASP